MNRYEKSKGVTIIGLGAYIPEEVRGNDFWPAEVVEKWGEKNKVNENKLNILHLRKVNEKNNLNIHPLLEEELKTICGDPFVGMKERRVSKVSPSVMEKLACEEALKDADVSPEEIDLFMGFSLPGDLVYPPDVFKLHYELGLKNAKCFEVNAICFSFLNMLDIAQQYIKTGCAKKILFFTSNKYSEVMDYTSSVSVAAGDGAVAVVLDSCDVDLGIQILFQKVDSYFHDAMHLFRRKPIRKEKELFNKDELDLDEKVYFTIVESKKVRNIISKLPEWAEEVNQNIFGKNYFSPKNIDLLITNGAFVWYGRVVAKIFNIPVEKLEDNILKFSNMGGVNLPMNLYTAYKKGRLKKDNNVAFFSHGGGASYGGGILRWSK